MKIANYESMIGSETGWAQKKRLYRENKQRKNQKRRTVKMKTKKQTEKQELKYAPGDKVVYHLDLVTADTKKMRQMMVESMQAIANYCGLKA